MFSDRLRALRAERGLTQAQIVDELLKKQQVDVKLQSYSTYENGREPSYTLLSAFAKFFNVSTDYLIGHTDARNPENTDAMERYGLSEKALSILESFYTAQKHNSFTLTINTLIENSSVLGAIARYLYYTLDAHEYERYGGVVPFHIVYKYIKKGESSRWGEIKPPYPYDVEKNTEAIDNDVIKRVFLYEIQERLIDLLKQQEQIKHF